jgi:hypothetical protein
VFRITRKSGVGNPLGVKGSKGYAALRFNPS